MSEGSRRVSEPKARALTATSCRRGELRLPTVPMRRQQLLPDDSACAIIGVKMSDDAARIVEEWRKYIPPEVPKEDVVRVVAAYFPGSYELKEDSKSAKSTKKTRSGGSHFLIVQHECLRIVDAQGYSANFRGGRLPICPSGGRHVKADLVKNLLEALDIKDAYDRVTGQE